MRTDKTLAKDAVNSSPDWQRSEIAGADDARIDSRLQDGETIVDGRPAVHSLSGHERNHLFINEGAGSKFTDLSGLSGLDTDADSRCFVRLDYDRDGWQDIALVNANVSPLQLYHNDIAQLPGAEAGVIAIRFEGGNTTDAVSDLSNRDGYGAMVEVALPDGLILKREHRCGDGYAAQNSATMLVGIGQSAAADRITVRWPSGRESTVENVAEGTLITAYENREAGAFVSEPYRSARSSLPAPAPAPARDPFPLARKLPGKIQIYTTTATWCAACVGHLPALARLQDDRVALFGVPVDLEDDASRLAAYVEKTRPPYEMLSATTAADRQAVTTFLANALHTANPVLPSTVVTDGEGKVLAVTPGVPSLSEVRKWLH